jgi:RNA polymerase sigma factor (TIGR02999 family)
LVYSELRRLAAGYLRDERAAATLQPTVLVHEAYLRLVSQSMPDWESRSHFFGVAAHLMRQILVDHARKHNSEKRGGGAAKVALEDALGFAPERSSSMIALDDALNQLAKIDARQAKVIELRFFGGFSAEETAQALGVSGAKRKDDRRGLAQGGRPVPPRRRNRSRKPRRLGTPDVRGR